MIKSYVNMKRDMDLIRQILLSVEADEHGFVSKIEIPDYTQEQIDIYNKRQDKDRNRYRRRPGQPTLSPRYRSARG